LALFALEGQEETMTLTDLTVSRTIHATPGEVFDV